MAITFDGDNLLIILDTSPTVDVKELLYSDWKDWVRTDTNSRYAFAFDTAAGDPVDDAGKVVAPYFFLRNDLGWRIRPPEADANIRLIGNLFRRTPSLDMFVPTLGDFTVSLELEVSPQALLIDGVANSTVQSVETKVDALTDLHEADEEFTPTTATKRHRVTKAVLITKNVSGGNLQNTITIDE